MAWCIDILLCEFYITIVFCFYDIWNSTNIYRMSQEECARFRYGVPYVKVCRYNTKHLCPKLNGYGDNGQRKCGLLAGPHTVPVS